MKVVLTEKDRRILLGLLGAAEDTLLKGAPTATQEQRRDLPEALSNLMSLKRKLGG